MGLRLALLVGIVTCFALTGCGWNSSHKMYSVTAEVEDNFQEPPDSIGKTGAHDAVGPVRIAGDVEIIQSNDVLLPVVEKLKLDAIWAKRFSSNRETLPPLEALDHLRRVLDLQSVPGTNILKITVYSEVPQESADIANALAESYTTHSNEQEARHYQERVKSLRDRIIQQQKVVADRTANLEDLCDKEARALAIADHNPYVDTLSASPAQTISISALFSEITGIEGDIDNLITDGFENTHPRVLALKAEITRKHEQIGKRIAANFSRLDVTYPPALLTARDDFKEQLNFLDDLKSRLRQMLDRGPQSPVRIISRAVAPPP